MRQHIAGGDPVGFSLLCCTHQVGRTLTRVRPYPAKYVLYAWVRNLLSKAREDLGGRELSGISLPRLTPEQ
jgi:hypothetical protein